MVENDSVLGFFWDLVSLEQSVRVKAVDGLITQLKDSKDKQILNYALQRLVKGLGSSRKAARQGFSTALVHVLQNLAPDIAITKIFDLISEHLVVNGSCKSQEERDIYFGQVFGNVAISRYLIISQQDEENNVTKVIENLLALMNKKSYLREICAASICQIISEIPSKQFLNNVFPLVEDILKKEIGNASAEDIMINMLISSVYKNSRIISKMMENWDIKNLHEKNQINKVSHTLMATTEVCHPRVHSVWEMFFSDLVCHPVYLKDFWKQVIEDTLMKSSHQRKYLAMHLLLKVSSKITSDMVEVVFSKSILRCIINSRQSKENFLFKAVDHILAKLPDCAKSNKDEGVTLSVIKTLVGKNSSASFDSLTNSKTLENLAKKVKDKEGYFYWLRSVFLTGCTQETNDSNASKKDKDLCRRWVLNQLIVVAHSCKVERNIEIVVKIAHFLFLYGHFQVLKTRKKDEELREACCEELGDAITQLSKQRFNTLLSDLSNWNFDAETGQKHQVIKGFGSDGFFLTWSILLFGKKLLENPKHVQLLQTWTPQVFDTFNEVVDGLADVNVEERKVVNNKGVQLIMHHATLQLFTNDEGAVTALQDIRKCFAKADENSTVRNVKDAEPHWTEVLCEVLLVFLAKPSHLMRHVVDTTFQSVAPYLTEEALNIILKVLKPKKKGSEHEDFVLDDEGEQEQDEENENENESGDEYEDTTTNEKDNKTSDDEDDDEEDNMQINEAFKMQIHAALGEAAYMSKSFDVGAVVEDEDKESSDIDMDTCDPRVLDAMDQSLSNIFHQKKQKEQEKKDQKSLEKSIVHFKLRVLDLIEIFIKKQGTERNVLLLLQPLIDVIKTSQSRTDEVNLLERCIGVFKNKLCQQRHLPIVIESDVELIHGMIENLLEMAKRTGSSALVVSYITYGIMYLIRVLRGSKDHPSPIKTRSQWKHNKKQVAEIITGETFLDEKRLIDSFNEALKHYMLEKSSSLQPFLFEEFIKRFPEFGWMLGTGLSVYLNTACNNYRKLKCCQLINSLLSKKTSNQEENMKELTPRIISSLENIFHSTVEVSCSLKAKHIRDMLHLCLNLENSLKNYQSIIVDYDGLKEAIESAMESDVAKRSPSLQSKMKRFNASLKEKTIVPTKRKKRK